VTVRHDFAHALPDSISDEAGALVEPLAVMVWAWQAAAIGPGKRVVVTGAGPVGLLVAQTARTLQSARCRDTDVTSKRLDPPRVWAAAGGRRPI
jgi:L-iditol 2-dehydrogenase